MLVLLSSRTVGTVVIFCIQGVHRFSAPWESNLRPWWRAAVSNLLEKYRRGRQVWTGLFDSYSMTLTTNNLSLMTLPCCHSFHDACVIAWLSKAANCPLCRLNSRRLKFLQQNHTFVIHPFKFSGLSCRLTTRSGRKWRNRRSARRREKKTWKPCTTACLANYILVSVIDFWINCIPVLDSVIVKEMAIPETKQSLLHCSFTSFKILRERG